MYPYKFVKYPEEKNIKTEVWQKYVRLIPVDLLATYLVRSILSTFDSGFFLGN